MSLQMSATNGITGQAIPATTGVLLCDLWPLISKRLPVAGVTTLSPKIRQVIWVSLRKTPTIASNIELLLPPDGHDLQGERLRARDMNPCPPDHPSFDTVELAEAAGTVVRVRVLRIVGLCALHTYDRLRGTCATPHGACAVRAHLAARTPSAPHSCRRSRCSPSLAPTAACKPTWVAPCRSKCKTFSTSSRSVHHVPLY